MRLRKTSFLAKLLIAVLVIYALITLVRLQDKINTAEAEAEALRSAVQYAEQEKAGLEQAIDKLGSEESIKRIAREQLGMVSEGEKVFYDSDD